MGARHYSPSLGRFLQPDPSPGETSVYAYVGNNPVSRADPDGKFWVVVVGIVILVVRVGGVVARVAPRVAPWLIRTGRLVGKVGKRAQRLPRVTITKWVGHHTIPRQILNRLPQAVRNNPLIRGTRGCKNIWSIPEAIHLLLHRGRGGGDYNRRWLEELGKIGGPSKATVSDILRIREKLTKEFNIGKYKPRTQRC
jgi:hypothetical protein